MYVSFYGLYDWTFNLRFDTAVFEKEKKNPVKKVKKYFQPHTEFFDNSNLGAKWKETCSIWKLTHRENDSK